MGVIVEQTRKAAAENEEKLAKQKLVQQQRELEVLSARNLGISYFCPIWRNRGTCGSPGITTTARTVGTAVLWEWICMLWQWI